MPKSLVIVSVAVLAVAALGFLVGRTDDDRQPPSRVAAPDGPGALLGVQYDWTRLTVEDVEQRLGITPAVVGVFARVPFGADDYATIDRAGQEALDAGAALMVTLEPHEGFEAVDAPARRSMTAWLRSWNDRGLPILVRYAHEMNGDWYPWGQQPEAFVDSFRLVAAAIREAGPRSEIMWAPNEGTGYPFRSDGLAVEGDPYAPYYPGDDHVDWVGLTVYHFGHAPPWGENVVPEDGKFLDRVHGRYDGLGGDARAVPDFHAEYVSGRDKPFAIAETAALFVPDSSSGDAEVEIKRAWAGQLFAPELPDRLPGLDLIMWFDHVKREEAVPGVLSDWSVTSDDEVRRAFVGTFPDWLEFADAIDP